MTEEDISKMENSKKNRREAIPIYRPGMFKRGVDATLSGEPSVDSKPPELPRRPRPMPSPLSSARSTGKLDQSHRRRSNDTDSLHSYRNDSGSTTPDAVSICSERRNSWGRGGGVRTFSRGRGRSRERNDNVRSEIGGQSHASSSNRNDRNDYRNNRSQDDRGFDRGYKRDNGYRKPYNSTQSLYNSRMPGGYLDEGKSNQRPLKQDFHQRFNRNGNERASMRAEGGQRRPQRKRNDSINSTQSEWPQPTQELHVDTGPETQSQAGDALSATSIDYFSICQSFESMGSFNWNDDIEELERKQEEEKKRLEEETTKKLEKRLESCESGRDLQKALTENKGRPIRGIMRINIDDGIPADPSPRNNERPPPHPKNRRERGRRQRRDSGSSSVTGSIVEEEENEDDLASGEKTPTGCYPQNHRNNQRGQRKPSREENKPPRNIPEGDRILPTNSSRLAGRLSTSNGIHRGVYQPPAMRRTTDAVGSSPVDLKGNRHSENDMLKKSTKEQNIYDKIAEDEGRKIEQLNHAISQLLPLVAETKDVRAAEKLLQLSNKLRTIYIDVLLKDISFTFSKNLEQHLWKQAFHRIIDALKKGSNSVNSNSKTIRTIFLQFLDESITYYTVLISQIENAFNVSFEMELYWSNGLPTDDFFSLLHAEKPVKYDEPSQKIALKSLSRHLLCLGDLYRNKALVEGSEDYSASRAWYLKAALLWPSSGHPYNQLAVIAFYSERVLDEIFFCIRAVGAGHPYDAARDRLNLRLAAMRKKVEKYEVLLNNEQGRIKTELAEIGIDQREHWILPEINKHAEEPTTSTSINPSQLHRRAVCYLIHTAGLLISKIGMESFASVSERSFTQLDALLSLEEAPITCNQLIQFSIIFIYAINVTAVKGERDTVSVQQQCAVETLITFFGVLLKPLYNVNFESLFKGLSHLPKQALRVLPAISILSYWFKSEKGITINNQMISLAGLKFSDLDIDTWSYLTKIANSTSPLIDANLLGNIQHTTETDSYILPEILYVSSFISVYPNIPESVALQLSTETNIDQSIHVRIRLLYDLIQTLVQTYSNTIGFDKVSKNYIKMKPETFDSTFTSSGGQSETNEEDLSRDEILARELHRRCLLVIKPKYIVPDTNALVDHLSLFQKILNSQFYEILIPTIVLDELQGLSRPGIDARSEQVAVEARKCIAWLKEKVKEKSPIMHTLTTHGNTVTFRILTEETNDYGIGKINDDRILQACVKFLDRNPVMPFGQLTIPHGTEAIYSNLVLLSEDRGICIKATSQNVPTRTIQHFVKWSKI